MARYIEETDVYKLVEPRGVAKVHCSQIDELPRADVVPKSEVERLQGRIAELQIDLHYSVCREDEARQKVAREIFEEMDGITELFIKGLIGELEMYDQLAELKKKYTGEK